MRSARCEIDEDTPPAAVDDLRALPELATDTTVTLAWTASGDDGPGPAPADLYRFIAVDVATDDIINSEGSRAPASPGTPETLVMRGLTPGTVYQVTLEVSDDVDNASIANVAEAVTVGSIACTTDGDCPGGDVCLPSSVCGLADDIAPAPIVDLAVDVLRSTDSSVAHVCGYRHRSATTRTSRRARRPR